MVDISKLTIDDEYIIITKTKYKNKILVKTYTGTCLGSYSGKNRGCLFADVACINKPYDVKYPVKLLKMFSNLDQYIELKQMKIIVNNAKIARQNMEKRALNIILKKIVNEEFQW